ncbi:MAG: lysine exporter LysO family protein [Candidatus Cloacimonadota bacterium]|nr:lysine exporter LysO family protein [Candidatus Cloacimonadota bacterium]
MKNSIIILTFFIIGILLGTSGLQSQFLIETDLSLYALYFLILLVGVSIGADRKSWQILWKAKLRILLVPLTTILGTLIACALISPLLENVGLKESLAIGSGFGYYSLSSIIITQKAGEFLGVIALLANIIRELITLLFTPFMVKFFGKIAPISAGGATSMDTTLPIITRFSGHQYAFIAIVHGTILTILVPILVNFTLSL